MGGRLPRALDFWEERLAARASHVVQRRVGARALRRPRGPDHELVVEAGPDPPLTAVHPEVSAEHALQGFAGVRAYSARPDASEPLL